jgi:hypothetical protein
MTTVSIMMFAPRILPRYLVGAALMSTRNKGSGSGFRQTQQSPLVLKVSRNAAIHYRVGRALHEACLIGF